MKIKFYATGGTIDKVYFDARSEYQIGKPQVEEILKDSNVAFEYEVESILQKDSSEMTEADRIVIRRLVEKEICPRIVITHGTDTMTETAKSLLGIEDKTIDSDRRDGACPFALHGRDFQRRLRRRRSTEFSGGRLYHDERLRLRSR